ncbi:peptidyl-Lys metalloendopeptidase [Ceratobasidium sp. AG-Ba]|nr:peptidyl-Lys metalloendopeptidase [Ceratobasidium sp. AG-Ba]
MWVSLALLSVPVLATPALDLQMTAPSQVDINRLVIKTRLTNVGDESLMILSEPTSILSLVPTNKFSFTANTAAPSFTGIRLKYSPTKRKDAKSTYITLEPGQSVERVHSLAGVYDFSQSGPGWYKFTASRLFRHLNKSGSLERIRATSGSGQFRLSGALSASRGVPVNRIKQVVSFNKCSPIQQNTIRLAAERADGYVDEALAFLARRHRDGDQYSTWFGDYTKERRDDVVAGYEGIGHHATRTTYDCECHAAAGEAGVFTYVYPDTLGTIYVCDAFWDAPLFGLDSQAGAILQVNSQFVAYADASDTFFAQQECKDLAAENPLGAARNGNNYEYFAETMALHRLG